MSTASAARAALTSTVTHRLECTLARTPRSDPVEVARIIGPGVAQVLADADALVVAAVAEALAVREGVETVTAAAAA